MDKWLRNTISQGPLFASLGSNSLICVYLVSPAKLRFL